MTEKKKKQAKKAEVSKKSLTKPVKITLISGSIILTLLILSISGSLIYNHQYQNKIHPKVNIGNIDVSGLTIDEAKDLLHNKFENLLNQGFTVSYDGRIANIALQTLGSSDPDLVYDFISIDIDRAVNQAFNISRHGNTLKQTELALMQLFNQTNIELDIEITEHRINSQIRDNFPDAEKLSIPTKYSASFTGDDIALEVIEGSSGKEFNLEYLHQKLKKDLQSIDLTHYELEITETNPPLTTEQVEPTFETVKKIIARAPYNLNYQTETWREYNWTIGRNQVVNWLTPVKTNTVTGAIPASEKISLTISGPELDETFLQIKENIDIAPIDAKFEIVNGRVTEFIGSESGIQLDKDATKLEVLLTFADSENTNISIKAKTTPPNIATEDVNDLGIKEVIGSGWSDFSGSPANRIANIRHGANKLNGRLIAPGEQISLVKELRPFTEADGYLPELVIKGDEIIPEIGGGLCQIGTTAFRAAMNTGLQIDERRNHSLVVSYYNDPSNNNPGTDATLYDPAPDFKFSNDTDHHILLITDVNVSNGRLTFTFWGTSDGRKGYYTPPQITRTWSPGPTEYKITRDLPPGRQECQPAYTGMSTAFDYIVEYADGTEHRHTYTSQYRALPRICLVGFDPKEEGVDEDSADEEEDQLIPTE